MELEYLKFECLKESEMEFALMKVESWEKFGLKKFDCLIEHLKEVECLREADVLMNLKV